MRREEGEILFVGDKYDLAKVREHSITSSITIFIYQHPDAKTFKIKKDGVFMIGKYFKEKEGIAVHSYGDEKLVLEGDCYKPSLSGSPFHRESVPVQFLNISGINHD